MVIFLLAFHQNPVSIHLLPHACYMLCPSHPISNVITSKKGVPVKSKCLFSCVCWIAVAEPSTKGCWWRHRDIWSHVCAATAASGRRHESQRAHGSGKRHVARSLIRSLQRHISLQLSTRYLSIDLRVMLPSMWSCVHTLLLLRGHSCIINVNAERGLTSVQLADN